MPYWVRKAMIKDGDWPLSAAVPSTTERMAGSRTTDTTSQAMAEIPRSTNKPLRR
jgi:hypothetical protein